MISNYNSVSKQSRFLEDAYKTLPRKDYKLLASILNEWHASASLAQLLLKWKPYEIGDTRVLDSHLHILSFNVRGFDQRWGEVSLLAVEHRFDIIALGEVGAVDSTVIESAFEKYRYYYQAGENAHGGVLVLIRNGLQTKRVTCSIPNVCIIDVNLEKTMRLVALYAPASKTWKWDDVTPFISRECIMLGDFNVDLEKDGEKADGLLKWMDECCLGPCLPDSNTSLRSDRTIDYALTTGTNITIQTYEGETSSDHKPLLITATCDPIKNDAFAKTNWAVFSLVLSHVFEFWEKEWATGPYDGAYERLSSFLASLTVRCAQRSTRKDMKQTIPPDLVELLKQSRSLASKAKRKGDILLREEARRLRNRARFELRQFKCKRLEKQLKERFEAGDGSRLFWSKAKGHFKTAGTALRGFVATDGEVVKDPQRMADMAANYYENLFQEPEVMRPHPYVDAPLIE